MGNIIPKSIYDSGTPYDILAKLITNKYEPDFQLRDAPEHNVYNFLLRYPPLPMYNILGLNERRYYVKNYIETARGFQYNHTIRQKYDSFGTYGQPVDKIFGRGAYSFSFIYSHYTTRITTNNAGPNTVTPVIGLDTKIDVGNYSYLICHVTLISIEYYSLPTQSNWRFGLFKNGFPSNSSALERSGTAVTTPYLWPNNTNFSFIVDIKELSGEYDFGIWAKYSNVGNGTNAGFEFAISNLYLAK